uniref:Uncharacterized protein n=1 Tax=Percolomonas cosmopolitus TaxID=63605 RepID=A0A7S1KKX6_9EUKA|mmetsp:Transcript_10188/g.37888  ORF Transcript_10188/g.37888 Transcript_10188/m.37888 type:complete len:146 (+) Transcript_10188:126-563(+)
MLSNSNIFLQNKPISPGALSPCPPDNVDKTKVVEISSLLVRRLEKNKFNFSELQQRKSTLKKQKSLNGMDCALILKNCLFRRREKKQRSMLCTKFSSPSQHQVPQSQSTQESRSSVEAKPFPKENRLRKLIRQASGNLLSSCGVK